MRSDPVSGRTTAIAVHPTTSDIAYVGTAQGGLYRTINGGGSWTQLMDAANPGLGGMPLAIGSVAIDPTDPSIVFVGTGEGNFIGDSFFGSGFYIITGADSIAPVVRGPFNAQASDGADIFTGRSIVSIAVDPTNHNNVFVTTSNGYGGLEGAPYFSRPPLGLYRTMNAMSGSPTWTRLQVTGTTSASTYTPSVVFEPGNPNNLIVAFIGDNVTDPSGIYRTTDPLSAAPTFTRSLALNPYFINVKLAINKVGAVVTVYATVDQNSGTLFKSVDGGASFVEKTAARGFANGQGFYDLAVAVDPTNANNVYIGGEGGSRTFRYSRDGGNSFTPSVTGLHVETHALAVSASSPQVIYTGNDGGIWRSEDAGASWKSLNNGSFNATQATGIALHPLDRNFSLIGTQDNGTIELRPDGKFFRVDGGDSGYPLIDSNAIDTENLTMYHTYYNAPSYVIGTGRNLKNSCALSGQWSFHGKYTTLLSSTVYCDGTTDTFNGIGIDNNVLYYAPMALGPGDPNTWYFGTDRLYRSTDRANTAVAITPMLDPVITTPPTFPPYGNAISAIAIAPQNDNIRIVGLESGKIYATTTGAALVQIAGPGASNGPTTTPTTSVNRIAIDPNNPNVAYIAFGGFGSSANPIPHLYKIPNLDQLSVPQAGNVSVIAMSNGLPDTAANALAIDPQSGSAGVDSSDIYLGAENGVYISRDGAASWTLYGQNLPRASIFGLEIQSPSRIIRAATHGRGVYETVLALQPAMPLLSKVVSRKTHGDAGVFDINMPLTGSPGVEDRTGGSEGAGNYTIVLSFTTPITAGNANVTAGVGSVSSVSFDNGDMIVHLTGVGNAQKLTFAATGVTNSTGVLSSVPVTIGFLTADANGDAVVNSGDAIVVRNNSGHLVDSTNFRSDITADGSINTGDALVVRSRSGSSLGGTVAAEEETPAGQAPR